MYNVNKLLILSNIMIILFFCGCYGEFYNYYISNNGQKSESYCLSDSVNKISYEFSGKYKLVADNILLSSVKITINNSSNYDLRIVENKLRLKSKYYEYDSVERENIIAIKRETKSTLLMDFVIHVPSSAPDEKFKLQDDDITILYLKGISLNGKELQIEPVRFIYSVKEI